MVKERRSKIKVKTSRLFSKFRFKVSIISLTDMRMMKESRHSPSSLLGHGLTATTEAAVSGQLMFLTTIASQCLTRGCMEGGMTSTVVVVLALLVVAVVVVAVVVFGVDVDEVVPFVTGSTIVVFRNAATEHRLN